MKPNGFVHKSMMCRSFNIWRKISGQDSHSFYKDPKLNFRNTKAIGLLPSSPCIDAGLSLDDANLDINHNPLPKGKTTDIGPFESAPPS